MDTPQRKRPYLFELDRLRVVTALSVVGVHVAGNTSFLDATSQALQMQNALVTMLHFTREVFMFVTGFALVYVYSGKPLPVRRFWKRRSIGVLFPYVAWSLFYVIFNDHPKNVLDFLRIAVPDLLNGGASYQLYYILLTLEFYIIFPVFLRWIERVKNHPWSVLGCSFGVEVAILYVTQSVLPGLPLSAAQYTTVAAVADRFVLVYQFYFVLGAMIALHLDAVRSWLMRHGQLVVGGAVVMLAALEGHYLYAYNVQHVSMNSAVAVLQPIMAPFSLAVIIFLYWLCLRIVTHTRSGLSPRRRRLWTELSDAMFGVYLVHPLFLGAVLTYVAPRLTFLPAALTEFLIWLLTAAASIALTLLLLRIPVVSRIVGRERPLPAWAMAMRVRLAEEWGTFWAAPFLGDRLSRQAAVSSVLPTGEAAPSEGRERDYPLGTSLSLASAERDGDKGTGPTSLSTAEGEASEAY